VTSAARIGDFGEVSGDDQRPHIVFTLAMSFSGRGIVLTGPTTASTHVKQTKEWLELRKELSPGDLPVEFP
jgi:hypothetical protein